MDWSNGSGMGCAIRPHPDSDSQAMACDLFATPHAGGDGVTMSPRIFQRRGFGVAMRERLLNEAFDRYLDWRAESDAVCEAYGHWSTASAAQGADSFAAYRAALDREERAARVYSTVVHRMKRIFDVDLDLGPSASEAPRR